MNFKEKFKKGLKGLNFGLSTGIPSIDKAIGGIQKAALYGIAAGPKVGKTTFVDFAFVISPYLEYLEILKKGNPANLILEWIYFSFEINRIKKEFKYVAFFMFHDYNITEFRHKDEVYEITPNYLEGKVKDNSGELIMPSIEHQKIVMKIYEDRIIPLFGEYDEKGKLLKKGLIIFVENRDNPTGLRNFIGRYSKDNGTWSHSTYTTTERDKFGKNREVTHEKRESWESNHQNKHTIIVLDHLRKLKRELNFSKKEIVDKMIEYQVEFRNWCGFTFVDIISLEFSKKEAFSFGSTILSAILDILVIKAES